MRRRLAELEVDIREHRALALRNAWIISQGGTPIAEASMAKVSGTELRTRIANTAMDILGREGALSVDNGVLASFRGAAQSSTTDCRRSSVSAAGPTRSSATSSRRPASAWRDEATTMNLDLSETQSLLQETVRSYLESEVPYDRHPRAGKGWQ